MRKLLLGVLEIDGSRRNGSFTLDMGAKAPPLFPMKVDDDTTYHKLKVHHDLELEHRRGPLNLLASMEFMNW